MPIGARGATTWTNSDVFNLGEWSNAANWSSGEPTSTVDAIFPAAIPNGSITITLVNEFCLSLTLNNNYTLSSGSLDIGGTGTVTVATGAIATISSVLDGSDGLTKAGAGQLNLSGGKTFTGGTIVNAGALSLTGSNVLPDAGAVTVNAGTFDINTRSDTVGAVTLVGGAISGTSGVLSGSSYDVKSGSISASLGGSGALTKSLGGLTVTLSGSNTYTGGTTVDFGTLALGASNVLANSGAVTVNGGTFDIGTRIDTVGTVTLLTGGIAGTGGVLSGSSYDVRSGSISASLGGSGALTKSLGGMTVTLSGSNSYTGGTIIANGTLALGANNALADSGAVTINVGTFDIGTRSDTVGAVTLETGSIAGTSGVLTASSFAVQSGTITGILGGVGASLTKSTSGTLTLFGANTYLGGTTINDGTLKLGASGVLADTGAVTLGSSAGLLDLNGNTETIGALAGGGPSAGNVSLGMGGALTVNQTTTTTFAGTISGDSASSLTKVGSGTLVLSGHNTYTGNTVINAGTLKLGTAFALHIDSRMTLANIAGAVLDLDGNNTDVGGLSGGGSAGGNVNLGDGILTVYSGPTSTFAGSISGTGMLEIRGSGIRIFTGSNTYTGGTSINGGTFQLGASGVLADSGAVQLLNTSGSLLSVNGQTETIGNLSGGGASGGHITLGSGALTVNQTSPNTYSGTISGTGSLTKDGSGALTLFALNTYTGGTTITAGTLTLLGGSALADTGAVTIGGGTLDLSSPETVGAVTLISGAIGGPVVLTGSSFAVQSGTISARIAGTGAVLTKTTVGTVTLSNSSFYTGGTSIVAGTLAIVSDTAINSGTGGVTFSGGTLQFNNYSSSLAFNTPNLKLGAASGSASTLGGVVSGSGSLTYSGPGTLILTATNTYSGGTTINAGTLQVGNGGTTGSITGNVTDNAELTFNRSSNLTFAGVISGTGSLKKAGTGTLFLTATNSYAGATTVNGGRLVLGQSLTNSSALTVETAATAELAAGANKVLKTPSLVVNGTGQLELSNNRVIVQFGTNPSPLATIRQYVINGRGGTDFGTATWQGTGGIASDAAAVGGIGDGVNQGDGISFAVGYVENSFLPSLGLPSYTSFGGQTVDSGSMLIRFTRGADCNLDGRVNTDDVTIVGALYNSAGTGEWYLGDFDYDGICDSDDVTVLGALYDATAPALSSAQLSAQYGSEFAAAFDRGRAMGSTVPEPSATLMLGLGGIGALGRRRRRELN